MVRVVEVNEPVVDQFPVFEDDGFTKHSGLLQADFTITVYLDGVVIPFVVTITEIGATGDYKVDFTPTATGLYEVQILVNYNKDIWHGVYDSQLLGPGTTIEDALEEILEQVNKIDGAPTLGTAAAVSGSLLDRICNKNPNKTYNQATDSLEALRDRVG